MSIAELRRLPSVEKLRIIEALWGDLAGDEEAFEISAWHEEELKKTEADFAAGRIEVLDWEEAKKELRKRFRWCFMQEFTQSNSGIAACWRAAFLMPSIIQSFRTKQSFFGCWTAAEPHDGSRSLSEKRGNETPRARLAQYWASVAGRGCAPRWALRFGV